MIGRFAFFIDTISFRGRLTFSCLGDGLAFAILRLAISFSVRLAGIPRSVTYRRLDQQGVLSTLAPGSESCSPFLLAVAFATSF